MYWAISFAAASAIAGCGQTATDGVEPVARADASLESARIYCESFAGCCQEQGVPVDVEVCETRLAAQFEEEFKENDATHTYDPNVAGECLAAIRANVQCGATLNAGALGTGCHGAFVGHVKPGEPCLANGDCENPAHGTARCDGSAQDADHPDKGVCMVGVATLEHDKLGEQCWTGCWDSYCDSVSPVGPDGKPVSVEIADACFREDGLYCTVDHECAQLLPLGAACHGTEECAGSARCASDTGVCSDPRADGASCGHDSDCQSLDCQNGVCRSTTPSADACRRGIPRL